MSGLWRELRPYFALWGPLLRLTLGTWTLLRRVVDLCLDGAGFDKLWRALFAVVLVGTFSRAVALAPMVMVPVTLAWLVAAWRSGPGPKDREQDEAAGPAEPAAPYRPSPDEMATALHKFADPHVHLVPVAVALGTTTGVVREVLGEMGVPIAGGVRMRGRSVSPGVRKTDLPPLPASSATPPVVDVVAGHASNNNGSNALVSLTKEGFWIIQDPEEPRQYHVAKPVGSSAEAADA